MCDHKAVPQKEAPIYTLMSTSTRRNKSKSGISFEDLGSISLALLHVPILIKTLHGIRSLSTRFEGLLEREPYPRRTTHFDS
jgi:hypothetical protein